MATQQKSQRKLFRIVTVLLPIAGPIIWAFPFITKYAANKALKKLDGLDGKVGRIRSSFWGTKWIINGLYIDMTHRDTHERVLLLAAERIVLTINRSLLWKGVIGGEVEVHTPDVTIMRTRMSRRIKQLSGMKPSLCISRAEVKNGRVVFADAGASPPVSVAMSKIDIQATGITNQTTDTRLPCAVLLKADLYGGAVDGNIKVGFMEDYPTFDLNMEVKDIDMPQLNDFFRTYAKFDVNKGSLGLYTEVAARDGQFKGYVKPVIHNLDVLGPEDKGMFNRLWQGLIGVAGAIFENTNGQIATKIPMQGSFKNPKINTWFAIGQTIANAFITALKPALDLDINFKSVTKSPGK